MALSEPAPSTTSRQRELQVAAARRAAPSSPAERHSSAAVLTSATMMTATRMLCTPLSPQPSAPSALTRGGYPDCPITNMWSLKSSRACACEWSSQPSRSAQSALVSKPAVGVASARSDSAAATTVPMRPTPTMTRSGVVPRDRSSRGLIDGHRHQNAMTPPPARTLSAIDHRTKPPPSRRKAPAATAASTAPVTGANGTVTKRHPASASEGRSPMTPRAMNERAAAQATLTAVAPAVDRCRGPRRRFLCASPSCRRAGGTVRTRRRPGTRQVRRCARSRAGRSGSTQAARR